MKRQVMVRSIAKEIGLEQKAVAKVLEKFLAETEKELVDNHSVQLRPLGTFVVKKRRAKIGRNPYINEPFPIPEHLTVCFKPSRRLKSRLNWKV